MVDEGQFIPDTDWAIIKKNMPSELKPFAMLAYHYGFRRGESLGVRPENLMEDHYHCTQQLNGIDKGFEREGSTVGKPRYANLKGRMARKVKHWFADPNDTYEWIETAFKEKLLCHPDTLSERWADLMEALGMDYGIHDLRHTFITKAVMKYPVAEVMLAAGHENIETTMRYFHDSRLLSEKGFAPTRKKSA